MRHLAVRGPRRSLLEGSGLAQPYQQRTPTRQDDHPPKKTRHRTIHQVSCASEFPAHQTTPAPRGAAMVTLAYSRATRVATHLQGFFGPVLGGTRKSEGGMGGGIYTNTFLYTGTLLSTAPPLAP